VISNWLGHGHLGEAPHLIRVSRDKRALWSFADHRAFRTVSAVQLLDIPGDPVR
jgi:hypothetical protein